MAGEKQKTSISESENIYTSMATPEFNHELLALIKSCQPLVYITTHEENRLLSYMKHLSVAIKRKCYTWDAYLGLRGIQDNKKIDSAGDDDTNPEEALNIIIKRIEGAENNLDDNSKGVIYLLFGFHRYLSHNCDPEIERRFKHLTVISDKATVILVGPSYASTESLDKDMAVLDFPYPNDEEIKNTLMSVLENAKSSIPSAPKRVKENEKDLVKACRGLTLNEAQQAYCKSVVMSKKTNKPVFDIPIILNEKKQIIRKNPILEYVEPKLKISDVGGLDPLVAWFEKRKLAFREDALAYGLSAPRGVLMIGIPGCGKSLIAKAIASLYELPLLRLDFGKIFNSLVGESEKTARDAIKLAESLSPCISGDTKILLASGEEITAEKLYERCLEDGAEVSEAVGENGIEFTARVNDPKIFTLVSHSLTSENVPHIPKPVAMKAIVKRFRGKKKLLKIKLSNGNEIKVTPEHKLLVQSDGVSCWKEAKEITKGDRIYSM